jgi:hypothetical protein
MERGEKYPVAFSGERQIMERRYNRFDAIPEGIRNMGVLLGWIGGILLTGCLLWFLTQPVRNMALLRSVNKVLAVSEEPWRLNAAIAPWGQSGRAMQAGTWFSVVNSTDWAVVFQIMTDGVSASFVAVVRTGGIVRSILPLSAHSVQMVKRLPQETVQIYIHRIESSYALLKDRGGA